MTLRQVLDHLFVTYGEELRNNILDNGRLRHLVKILVNGRSVKWLAHLDTPIHEGDTIAIFPPIGGGCNAFVHAAAMIHSHPTQALRSYP